VRAAGEVDAYNAAELRQVLEQARSEEGARILVCLKQVPYIDSTGLGVLVGVYKQTAESGGHLVVCCPAPQVRKVFEISGVEQLIQLHPDEASGLAALRRAKGGASDA